MKRNDVILVDGSLHLVTDVREQKNKELYISVAGAAVPMINPDAQIVLYFKRDGVIYFLREASWEEGRLNILAGASNLSIDDSYLPISVEEVLDIQEGNRREAYLREMGNPDGMSCSSTKFLGEIVLSYRKLRKGHAAESNA